MTDPINAPGHTDMMVPPESLDEWLKDSPLPPDDLAAAVAMIQRASETAKPDEWSGWDIADAAQPNPLPVDDAIATILNAVADGRLRIASEVRREALEEAADICKSKAKPFARQFVMRRLAKQGYAISSRAKQRLLVRLSRELRALIDKEPTP